CHVGVHDAGAARRSFPFIERFDFVAAVQESPWVVNKGAHPWGGWRYDDTGTDWHVDYDWLLVPNGHLEEGKPLAEWLPELPIDWRIADRFRFRDDELAEAERRAAEWGRFVQFYLGPKAANENAGQNRGPLWTPADWGRLAEFARADGCRVVVTGAEHDRDYLDVVRPHLGEFVDRVGKDPLPLTFATMRKAVGHVGYQSGLAIFGVFLGCNAATWWRPHGDSIHGPGENRVTFREEMATAWAPPGAVKDGRYLPLVYGRPNATPAAIWNHARTNWIRQNEVDA
ncbi:MAG: hypothetical protein ACRC1K_00470, partial [Planctomycetia bacterium]